MIMNYQEQIKKAVQEFYDVTKAFATSSHYTLSYWWVESNFGLDLNDEKVRSDVHEMSYSNGFQDLIQALDFDNIKKEVLVMIWERGERAKKEIEGVKEMYCVDLRSKITYDSVLTIFKTSSHDRAWDVANNYNCIHGNTDEEIEMLNNEETEGWTSHPYWATVYNNDPKVIEPKIEEVKEMKKYTLENYEEFSREALDMPPIEAFEDGTIDETEWYEENKIIITKGEHQIELEYNADNVSEMDRALREMYEVERDVRSATTGNTVGGGLRPTELKDILRIAIQNDWWTNCKDVKDFSEFIRKFIANIKDIGDVMRYYEMVRKDYKEATDICKCDFSKLDMSTMRINPNTIKEAISNLIGTNKELMYGVDEVGAGYDTVFVMDYSLKASGELIGWFYGAPDDEYIDGLIEDYKKRLFGEEE